MLTYNILLRTPDNAIRFVNTMNSLDGYFDLCMGSRTFDAKSVLGVLSMDLRRPMVLRVIKNGHSLEELNDRLEPYCI